MMSDVAAPIAFERHLPGSAGHAFVTYTARIGEWWPAGFRALAQQGPGSAIIEPVVGGRVYERGPTGEEHDWGTVVAYVEGRFLVHTFHLAQDHGHPTEVSVAFTDDGDGCTMAFEHRGWTADNAHVRPKFASEGGWAVVLGGYLELVASPRP
jgi:hypothetical protein